MFEIGEIGFDRFWTVYPRKAGKPKAEKAFRSLSKKDQFGAIQGAQYNAENNPQWRDKTLIPFPATFLNQRRWEDEIALDRKETVIENQGENPATMVWSALTQMFGESFIRKFGDRPNPVWTRQIACLKETEIKKGLRAIRDMGMEHPPSLPKFVECCKSGPIELPEFKALPRPEGDPRLADKAFEEMRRILGCR